MDQPSTVAFTAFADVWPRARETEIGAALCAIGAGRTFTIFDLYVSVYFLHYSLSAKILSSLYPPQISFQFSAFRTPPPPLSVCF